MLRGSHVEVEVVDADQPLRVPRPDQRAPHLDLSVLGLGADHEEVHVVLGLRGASLRDRHAALPGDDGGVHEGHRLVHDPGQHPFHRGQREDAGVLPGDPAHVLHVDGAHRLVGEARQDPPQPLGQGQEGADLLRDLRGGHVHRVRDELPPERQADHLGDGDAGLVLGLRRRRPQVRGDDHVLQAEERVRGDRLLLEDVQGGPAQVPLAEDPLERRLVHDAAAGRVDEARPGLHEPQLALPDEPLGLGEAG